MMAIKDAVDRNGTGKPKDKAEIKTEAQIAETHNPITNEKKPN